VTLTLKEILELIDKVAASGIAALEVERAGTRLRIEGKRAEVASAPSQAQPAGGAAAPAPPAPAAAPATAPGGAAEDEDTDSSWHVITSPIVGTFYRAASPEAEAFVAVGDRVSKGSVLCIVEAMKLMNEIECDVDGVIARVYPQNGQPVEYGEKLFAIQT
jgi:acetyl-CoA carboxylase biotin carboxyl carrier protein